MSNKPSERRTIYRLSQITARVQHYLQPSLGKRFWLKAEVSSGRSRAGAFYCDLIELDVAGQQTAKMRGNIWGSDLAAIQRKFTDAGLEFKLDDGTEICIQCSLRFHSTYGLSLNIHDADPKFAIGELELRRRRILLRLEQEGLFEPNKRLQIPLLPQRIGVVTSRTSAAFNDFARTLEQSNFGFTIFAADSAVQGKQAEAGVVAAIDALERLHVELIAIVRGGGSKTELSYLDNEVIARRIARCPIPIWTGIGHETDTSILDFVANQQFKTPTAVSVALVDRFSNLAGRISASLTRLRSTWQLRRKNAEKTLARNRSGLQQGTRKLLEITRSSLQVYKNAITHGLKSRMSHERGYIHETKARLMTAPKIVVSNFSRYLADATRRCRSGARRFVELNKEGLDGLRARFRSDRYLAVLSRECKRVNRDRRQLRSLFAKAIEHRGKQLLTKTSLFRLQRILDRLIAKRETLSAKLRLINAADPKLSLRRGFSLAYDDQGQLVKSIDQVRVGESLKVLVRDGAISSTIDGLEST